MADKILIDQNGVSSFEERPIGPASGPDDFSSDNLAYVPVSKVDDADQYVVIDIPGGTENLSGSGNLNFQLLQSQIMDENARVMDVPEFYRPAVSDGGLTSAAAGSQPGIAPADASVRPYANAFNGGSEGGGSGGSARYSDSLEDRSSTFTANTVPSSPANTSQTLSTFQSESITTTGRDGANGRDGMNGTDGTDGTNGNGGGGDGDTTVIYNNSSVINNYTNVVNNGTYNNTTNNTIINNVTNNNGGDGGDHHHHHDITLIDLGDVTGTVTTITTNITNNVTDIVTNTTDNLFETVNNVTNNLTTITTGITDNLFTTIDNVTNNTFETVNNLLETVTNILPPLGGGEGGLLPLDLGGIIGAGQTQPDHDVALTGDLQGIVGGLLGGDSTVILNGVEDVVGDIDLGLGLHSGLLGNNNPGGVDQAGDVTINTDVDLLNNGLLNNGLSFNIDPLEQIIGDVDLNLGGAVNLLGDVAAPLLDNVAGGGSVLAPVGDALSGVAGGLLGQDPSNGDTDIALSLTGNAGPVEDIVQHLDVALNPVEDIVGDVDLGINGGLNLLHGADTSASESPTDLGIGLDLQLAGHQIDLPDIGLNLDLVENITGDIDLNIDLGTNLLGNTAGGIIDSLAGGGTALAPVGDAVSDVVGTVLGDPSDASTPVNQLLDIVNGITGGNDTILSTVTETVFDVSQNPLDIGHVVGDLAGGDLLNNLTGGLTDGLGGDLASGLTDGLSGLLGGLAGGGTGPEVPDVLSSVDDLLGQVSGSLGSIDVMADLGISTLISAPDSNAITNILSQAPEQIVSTPWVESVVHGAVTDTTTALTGAVENLLSDPVGGVLGGLGGLGDLGGGGGGDHHHGIIRGLFG